MGYSHGLGTLIGLLVRMCLRIVLILLARITRVLLGRWLLVTDLSWKRGTLPVRWLGVLSLLRLRLIILLGLLPLARLLRRCTHRMVRIVFVSGTALRGLPRRTRVLRQRESLLPLLPGITGWLMLAGRVRRVGIISLRFALVILMFPPRSCPIIGLI